MNLEALRKAIAALPEGAERKALESELAALEASLKESKPAPQQQAPPVASTSTSDALLQEALGKINNLEAMYLEEKKRNEEAQKHLAQRAQQEQQTKVAGVVDEAIKAGKIAAGEKDKWVSRLTKDFEEWSGHLAEIPTTQAPPPAGGKGGKGMAKLPSGSTAEERRQSVTELRDRAESEISSFFSTN